MKKNFLFLLFLSFNSFVECFASDVRRDNRIREIQEFEREKRQDIQLFEDKLKEADKKQDPFEKIIALAKAYLFLIHASYFPAEVHKLQSSLKHACDECQTENDNVQKQKKLEIYQKIKDQSDKISLIYQEISQMEIGCSGLYPMAMVFHSILKRLVQEKGL